MKAVILEGNTSSNKGTGLAFASSNDEVGASLIFKDTGNHSQGELQFYTKDSTSDDVAPEQRMVIKNDGKVVLYTGVRI